MARIVPIEITVTELPHFERLVQFLQDAEQHAEESDDYALRDLVDDARDDLARLWR